MFVLVQKVYIYINIYKIIIILFKLKLTKNFSEDIQENICVIQNTIVLSDTDKLSDRNI